MGSHFTKRGERKGGGRRPGLPAVEAPPELYAAYATVFRNEMATITALPTETIEEILFAISSGEGGHLNQGRYHKAIFEKYFRGLDWRWPEYDRWKAFFIKFGKWPTAWPKWDRVHSAKRNATRVRLELYTIQMRTILFRAKSLSDRQRRVASGNLDGSIISTLPEDSEIVDRARAMLPDARPPLFPYDLSMWKADIPG